MMFQHDLCEVSAARFFTMLVISAVALPAARIGVAAEKPATIEDVRTGWSKRQKSFRTLKLHWRREYSSVWHDPARGGRKPDGAPKEGESYSYVQNAVVRFSGEKLDLRIGTKGAERFGASVLDRCAFDGTQSRALLILSSPDVLTQGVLSSKRHEFGPNKALFLPLAIVFRPLVPTISQFELKNLRLEPKESGETIVDGHVCRMVTRSANDVIEYVFYVDPKADNLVRRIESRVNGRRSIQWDISYSRDKIHGWIPSTWTMEWRRENDKLGSRTKSRTIKYEINKPIPEVDFHIAFPANARVIDKRQRR